MCHSKITSNGREVRYTNAQRKKHFQQMTKNEKQLLSILVSNLCNQELHITRHAFNHVDNLSMDDIYYTINDCEIVEFNTVNNSSFRVLLRGNNPCFYSIVDGFEIDYVLCVVIELQTNTVVTCFVNEKLDTHSSINWDRYDATLNIIEIASMN